MIATLLNTGSGALVNSLGNDYFGAFELTTGTGASGGLLIQFDFTGSAIRTPSMSIELVPLNSAAQSLGAHASPNPNSPGAQTGINFYSFGTVTDNTLYQFAYKII